MIRFKLLAVLLLLALVPPTMGQSPPAFKSLEAGTVTFPDGSTKKLSELPPEQQKQVMEFTGWGRVWEDATGKHHTVADLVAVVGDSVELEKTDGKTVTVPLEKLSKADRVYAESRRKLSEALPEKFSVKVIGILDGDTIDVLLNRRQYRIRLAGIDAPEKSQAFGNKAKKHLGELVFGKWVTGVTESTDRYGRSVCLVFVNGVRVDHDMLENGLAWHYLKYSDDPLRAAFEAEAKAFKRNIWSESGPIPPWDWRKWGTAKRKHWLATGEIKEPPAEKPPVVMAEKPPKVKQPIVSKPEPPPVRKVAPKLDHWLNTKGNVRHNSGCRWYRNTKHGRMCSGTEGKACGQCGG